MMVPPLSERPVTEEDEEQFRRESMPRTYTLRQRWADYRAEAKANRPKGAKARVRAWLHVEPFYWGMRATYVVLVVGAAFAVYINGVAEGWWHAWGEKPTVAATTTPAARPVPSASSSTDAAMSGGYQIGPDGVLVRPAEHAASTYTKPELPEEAKENTERGAELAAEHFLALENYAWNTGDTQPLADMSEPGDNFSGSYITPSKVPKQRRGTTLTSLSMRGTQETHNRSLICLTRHQISPRATLPIPKRCIQMVGHLGTPQQCKRYSAWKRFPHKEERFHLTP